MPWQDAIGGTATAAIDFDVRRKRSRTFFAVEELTFAVTLLVAFGTIRDARHCTFTAGRRGPRVLSLIMTLDPNEPKPIPAVKVRQGSRGSQVLTVLIVGLLLAAVAWGVAEFYGEAVDPPSPVTEQAPS